MSETLGEDGPRDLESVEMREDEFSDNGDICRKRKRSSSSEEEEVVEEEEENDGFKTPTRPENRIPEVKECPPAPRRDGKRYSERFRGRTCRRRLSFSSENSLATFITDMQWKTTTTRTIKK